MLNVGETHYPYARPNEDSSMWPRISGVNGVFKKMGEQIDPENPDFKETFQFFDAEKMEQLRQRQIDTVRYLDGVFEQLYDLVPRNTHIIVTADHGELFGEQGYFGHGPIMHEKCFEVPYLEGKLR
jgi:arylsulfatase A-like enzyme